MVEIAYADLEFYKLTFHGINIPDNDFESTAEKASDFIDVITFDRLIDGLPENERVQSKIKKAVCSVAEYLYQIDLAKKQAMISANSGNSQTTINGTHTGVITSVSSGSESISYAAPSQLASGAKEWSALYSVVGNEQKTNKLLYDAAKMYLSGTRDDNGVPLLYAGIG